MMVCCKIGIPIVLSLIFFNASSDEREIYVSPSGNDSSNCSKEAKCRTLHRALQLASGISLVKIIASKGNYSLHERHNLTKIASFHLFGNGSSRDDVQVTCNENVSLSFTLSENITFQGVKFHKCGGWHHSSEQYPKYPKLKGLKFKAALDFRYCRNLRIFDVDISSSPGLGANLYHVGGVVNFTNCLFEENYARDNNSIVNENGSYVYSGGGVNIMLNTYGHDTVNVTPSKHDSYQHNNIYSFTNCNFLGNKAQWSITANETEKRGPNTPKLPFSGGGGLAAYLGGNASGCIIKIQSCVFQNNTALWGGGLQVEMGDKSEQNKLVVRETTFEKNVAVYYGGGARIGNWPHKGDQLGINKFMMHNTSFLSNTATQGAGGTTVYGKTIPRKCTKHSDPDVTQFSFNDCRWIKNVGNIGAAMSMFLYNQNEDAVGPEIPYHVRFENALFLLNNVFLLDSNLMIGQGSLYSVQVPIIFKKNAQFEGNNYSALLLDGSVIQVHGTLNFTNNTGIRGGAIAMYGRSRIIFYENSNLTFEGNTGDDKGGALYIQAPGPPLVSYNATDTNSHPCFFGYSNSSMNYNEWKTNVSFKNNYAHLGQSVYATTLKNCRQVGESRKHNDVLKWNFIKFENKTSLRDEVVTDPVNITYNMEDWKVAPGEVFNATVHLIDEVNNSVPGIVNVSINSINPSSVVLLRPQSPFLVTNGSIRNIRLLGVNGGSFSVGLTYLGSQNLRTTLFGLSLKKCYPGFTYSHSSKRCECMTATPSRQSTGISRCGPYRKTVYVKESYWAGSVSGEFATYLCPTGYCKSSSNRSQEYRYVVGQVCNDKRDPSSVLCGKCKKDFSITFGSEQCSEKCSNLDVLYLIPFGLGLVLLVVIVMLIDLDFFTGYLNAWLYSYQVMKLLTPEKFQFDPFIEFVIGLVNIQIRFGHHSICFAKGLDDADKLMMMYAIPTFILMVVSFLKWLVGAYPNWCFSKRVKAPFRAICTLIVLCYTDITRISLKILHPANVGSKTVLYVNGSLEFFHGKHLWYAIVAVIYILAFVLPFPLILLFRPFLTRGLRPVLNLNRWLPFFDAFQSCFKNKYRWCAAFYFICRLGILAIYTYIPACPGRRVLLEGTCILILVIFASLRPYKEACDVRQGERSYEWINRSDVVLLTTLALIAVVSSPIDMPSETTENQKIFVIVVKVLAYVPLLVLLVLARRVFLTYCPGIGVANHFRREDEMPFISEVSDVTQ
ncbi:uncharacterized protein [Montipora foliosa]|uniref:uncharacterized protein n=1 Tax=Montipora foliosa TaxID=591990 RepID=UPI0035F17AF8